MLKGKELGAAIGRAIALKKANGTLRTKIEVAEHFGVKPPAISDWCTRGTISKDKLPELWKFFADVAGPDHWGMDESEWPAGLVVAAKKRYPNAAEDRAHAPKHPVTRPHRALTRAARLTAAQLDQVDKFIDIIEALSTPRGDTDAPKGSETSRFRDLVPGDAAPGSTRATPRKDR